MNSNLLVKNARIWPSTDDAPIEGASLFIRNGRIEKIGKVKPQPGTVVDAGGALVLPGFVQTHLHLGHSLFRGLGGMDLRTLEAAHDAASLRASARLACAELIRGGTTAFLSMETVRHTDQVFQAVRECGLMGVIGQGLLDACPVEALAEDLDDILPRCDVLLDHLEDDGSGMLRLALAPHSALVCEDETLREAAAWARSRGLLLHTHCAERKEEVRALRDRHGMRNLELLHHLDFIGPDVCLAHCIHLSPDERALLCDSGTRVLCNPSATLKRGSGLSPLPDYLEAGIHVSLGTGSAACNNRLDAFTEMRTAALVHQLPAEQVVRLATLAGAEALRWDAEMGTIEVGKRANLVFIDPDSVHAVPGDDPAESVVFSHTAADVQMTMVNGKILFESGRFTTIDYEALVAEARSERAALLSRL